MALVVEDSVTERTLLAALASRCGLHVIQAEDAESALAVLARTGPDLVLLDLFLPDAEGLSLLARIREERPFIPVVVITCAEEKSHLEDALTLGALNFLRKPLRADELRFVLSRISRTLDEEEGLREALVAVVERSTQMTVPGDPTVIARVVAFLAREVRGNYPGHAVPLADIKLALFEALANAVEHGNLEIGYDRKQSALAEAEGLRTLVLRRLHEAPFATRSIHVTATYRPREVEYVLRDEGKGFDPGRYDPREALSDPERLHGRGLALIRHHMDEVTWNEAGNEIRMLRRLPPLAPLAGGPELTPSGSDSPPPAGTGRPAGS